MTKKNFTAKKSDVFTILTDRFVKALESGNIPWHKPWAGGKAGAYSYRSKKRYSLLNQCLLEHADAYITYKQLTDLGGHLLGDAKQEQVFEWFATVYEKKDKNGDPVLDDDGNAVTEKRFTFKYYPVYWIGYTDLVDPSKPAENIPARDITADEILFNYLHNNKELTFIDYKYSDSAYYQPATDTVVVPMLDQFDKTAEYYSTVFHELAHSTGANFRLKRDIQNVFGSHKYSKEELIAEFTASAICNMAGIATDSSNNNSTAYIQSWIKVLKSEPKWIAFAAAAADKAVDYMTKGL